MKLTYKAVSLDGRIARGVVSAKDNAEAASYLRSRGLTPIKISTSTTSLSSLLNFTNKSGTKDVLFFTRQLSSMLLSGLTLMQALGILRNQFSKPSMKQVVSEITTDIESGLSFSSSLAKHPELFSPIYISLIKAAETSGLMDKILVKVADNLERQDKLKSTIKSAMLYPIIVVIMMIAVVFIMMLFVVPPLSSLYESLNVELPFATQLIINSSNFTVNFWFIEIAAIIATVIGFKKWYSTPGGKAIVDKLVLKVPIFGPIIAQSTLAEFTSTFGLLVGTGTLVVNALKKSADIVSNDVYRKVILEVTRRVEKGVPIGDAMSFSPLFPPLVVEMTKIGEQTGKVDESLLKVSEYYQREVETMVKNLTTALEPFILVVLGGGIGFLIFSIITPIYSILSSVK